MLSLHLTHKGHEEAIEPSPNLPASHHKAIAASCRCRTGAYGYSLSACRGGLSQEREAWLPSRAHFSGPVRALSPLSRALFQQERRTAGQLEQIEPHVWTTPWNIHSQATPHGATSFTSLAPSVCKVAISNRRIVGLQDRLVTFPYRKPGSPRPRTTRLDVLEFLRRFLQHVLPAGCMKVRHFGFMHTNCRIQTDTIRQLITSHTGATLAQPEAPPPPWRRCPVPTGAHRSSS